MNPNYGTSTPPEQQSVKMSKLLVTKTASGSETFDFFCHLLKATVDTYSYQLIHSFCNMASNVIKVAVLAVLLGYAVAQEGKLSIYLLLSQVR